MKTENVQEHREKIAYNRGIQSERARIKKEIENFDFEKVQGISLGGKINKGIKQELLKSLGEKEQ